MNIPSDARLRYEAMYYYAAERHAFAGAIAQTTYSNRDGKRPTADDIYDALAIASHCDELVGLAKEEWKQSKMV